MPTALFSSFGLLIVVSIRLGIHIRLRLYLWPLSSVMLCVNGCFRRRPVVRDSSADPHFLGGIGRRATRRPLDGEIGWKREGMDEMSCISFFYFTLDLKYNTYS